MANIVCSCVFKGSAKHTLGLWLKVPLQYGASTPHLKPKGLRFRGLGFSSLMPVESPQNLNSAHSSEALQVQPVNSFAYTESGEPVDFNDPSVLATSKDGEHYVCLGIGDSRG